tara:strand:- start:4743 stop:5006 length:264 start_codon:yes stop_codon:yes gene_type:complete
MPHCLIEGSRTLGQLIEPAELLCLLHDTAVASGLFKPGEVKVRLSLYPHYCVGGVQDGFHPADFLQPGWPLRCAEKATVEPSGARTG